MSRSSFIKHIKSLNQEELSDEIKMLYTKFKDVKSYYALELGSDEERKKMYNKAKKDITKLYLLRGKFRKRPKVQKLNTLLSGLKKNAIFPHELIDLYLHSVEHALAFSKARKMTEPTKNHIVKSYTEALKIISDSLMENEHDERCKQIISNVYYFSPLFDQMKNLYQNTFSK